MKELIELYPYQYQGIGLLIQNNYNLLADEMGLGKSAQIIRAADQINADKILIICPSNARINWQREFKKFSTKNRGFYIPESQQCKIVQSPNTVTLVSYDLLPYFWKSLRSKTNYQYDLVVPDEAHFLKELKTKRTKCAYGKEGFLHFTPRMWLVTGTPAPNHIGEMWSCLFTFRRTTLSYEQFVRKFCTTRPSPYGFRGYTITGTNELATGEIKQMLKGFMIRRLKKNVLKDLPKVTYKTEYVEAGEIDFDTSADFIGYVFPIDRRDVFEKEFKEQAELVSKTIDSLGWAKPASSVGLEALSSSVSTLRKAIGLKKVKPVGDIIHQELTDKAYHKIVIFAVHRSVIEGLRERLKDFHPVTLYGGTPPNKRQHNIDKFTYKEHCRVFIGNILAAGVAINLTVAHQLAFIEEDWVPGNNAQAVKRVDRIGQIFPVTVRFFAIAGGVDEKITKVWKRKTKELTKIFDED